MMQKTELRESDFPEHGNCDTKITEDDTNLDFLISEHCRLAQLEPDDYRFKSPATVCYVENCPVDLYPANMVTLTDLINAPNSFLKEGFFLCRTVTDSIKIRSLLMVIECPDPLMKNRGAFLSLGNYLPSLDEENEYRTPILSKGTILALKSSIFFKSSIDPIHAIKCDNPADVVILDDQKFNQLFPGLKWPSGEIRNEESSLVMRPWWNWWRAMKDWKAIAHLRLQKKNYVGALEAYTAALDCNPKDIETLTLRSKLYLDLKVYRKSLRDSEVILEMDNVHTNAICNKALSMIGLGQYTVAIEFLEWHIQKCRPIVDSQQRAKFTEIELKAKTWSRQEEFGEYDLISMLQCPSTFVHDCADHIGKVEQQKILGKGIGMVAKANIKCGELLIGTKALAMAYSDDDNPGKTWVLNSGARKLRSNTYMNLVASVAHRLIVDSELGKEVYGLYDGTERSVSKQIRDVSKYNYVDMESISSICDYNSFYGDTETFRYGDENAPEGLWPSGSYFNHSCFDANSSCMICGNFMLIRANKNIKKCEEITLCYVPCSTPYLERLSVFSSYGFVCDCTMCLLDAKDTDLIHIRRQEILCKLRHLQVETHSRLPFIKKLIKELRDIGHSEPKLNIFMQQPLFGLAKIYMKCRDYHCATEILNSLNDSSFGTIMNEVSTQSCCFAIVCCMNSKQIIQAETLVIALKSNLIQKYGTNSKEILKYEMRKYISEDIAEAVVRSGITN